MFFKETYPASISGMLLREELRNHLYMEAMLKYESLVEAADKQNIIAYNLVNFKLDELEYTWTVDLDVGVMTMTVFNRGCNIPLIMMSENMPWKGDIHHKHMGEFVNHHLESCAENRRQQGAEFVLRTLNKISIKWMTKQIEDIRRTNTDAAAAAYVNGSTVAAAETYVKGSAVGNEN